MSCDSEVVLSVRGVSKRFEMYAKPADRLRQLLLGRFGKRFYREFWALRDVSFDVRRIVVVNDGSPGNCREIVARYGDRVRYFEHDTNRSLLQARLTGIAKARGEYVIHVDSDDFVEDGLVAALAQEVASANGPDVIVYQTKMCTGAGSRSAGHNHAPARMSGQEAVEEILSGRAFWPVCGKCFRTSLCRLARTEMRIEDGFYLNSTEDLCQTLPMLLLARTVSFIAYCGYGYWQNPNSMTHKGCNAAWALRAAEENGKSIRAVVAFAGRLGLPDPLVARIRNLAKRTVEWLLEEVDPLSDHEWSRVVDGLFRCYGPAFALEMLAELKPDFFQRWTPGNDVFPPSRPRPVRNIASVCWHCRFGGAERANWLWMKEMCGLGKSVTWFYDSESGPECAKVEMPSGLRGVPLVTKELAARVRTLISGLEAHGIDTVVLVDHWRPSAFVDLLAAKCAGCRVVFADHSSFLFPLDAFEPTLYRMRERFCPLADVVTVLSPVNVDWWRRSGVRNVVYMPNLLTFQVGKGGAEGRKAALADTVELLWCGRICRRKNPNAAIEALQLLKEAHPQRKFHLTLLGRYESAEMRAQVERSVASRRLADFVSIPGEVGDVAPYYAKATVLLVTSRIEGAPMVIAEAKSHGVPTVMFALPYVAGTAEADGVVSVESGNTRALADAVARLVSDQGQYGEMSRASVKSLDGVRESVLSRWQAVFRELESGEARKGLPCETGTDASHLLDMTLDGLESVAEGLADAKASLAGQFAKAEDELMACVSSRSYVIGRAATWPFRMARGVLRSLRENGLGYTLRRIPVKAANLSASRFGRTGSGSEGSGPS